MQRLAETCDTEGADISGECRELSSAISSIEEKAEKYNDNNSSSSTSETK